jgi:hypothetical protein
VFMEIHDINGRSGWFIPIDFCWPALIKNSAPTIRHNKIDGWTS